MAYGRYGIEEKYTRPSVVTAGEKESPGRYKRRREYNIKMDVKHVGGHRLG